MNLRPCLLALAAATVLCPAHGAPAPATRPTPLLGEAPRAVARASATAAQAFLPTVAATYGDSSYGLVVDTSKREQARVFFQTVYQSSTNVPSGWTGSIAGGAAGTTSQEFRDAVARRVNYYRAMAGMPAAVTLSDAYNAKDQQAALMMSANHALSHTPPLTWLNYTVDGATAAGSSNINYGSNGPDAIDAYIQDPGASNAAGGHRRWVLYPPSVLMGTGDVDGTGNHDQANALWIMDRAGFLGDEPPTRDGFVAWPPAGFVPYQTVFPRWSFSVPGGDVSAATVTMQRAGQAVAVRQEIIAPGYGDSTVMWVPDGQGTDFMTPTAPAGGGDVVYNVSVTNVRVGGALKTFTYQVTTFDPSKPGADTVLPTLSGPAQPAVGTPNSYRFDAVPGATGYRWTAWPVTALTLNLNAEGGMGAATAFPAGTDLTANTAGQSGAAAYQLNSGPASGSPQAVLSGATGASLTVDAAVLPAAGSALQFRSKVGFNTVSETAEVQVSKDGGANWQDVYSQVGTGQPEAGFTAKSVDLSAFAGQSLRVRFVYSAPYGKLFYPRISDAGWFVDDITVTNARSVGTARPTALADGALSFDFSPAAGSYALQVTPLFFGGYAADAGPLLFVDAKTDSGGGGSGGGGTGGGGIGGGGTGTPEVTVTASVPSVTAGGGGTGVFTVTRTGDTTGEITVAYVVKGSAVDGTDYVLLSGKKKLKAGKASVKIKVTPLGAAAGGSVKRVVKLTLLTGDGYTLGAAASAKVKIVW